MEQYATCSEQTKKILEIDLQLANGKIDLLQEALALEKQKLITEYFEFGVNIISLIFLLVCLYLVFILIKKN